MKLLDIAQKTQLHHIAQKQTNQNPQKRHFIACFGSREGTLASLCLLRVHFCASWPSKQHFSSWFCNWGGTVEYFGSQKDTLTSVWRSIRHFKACFAAKRALYCTFSNNLASRLGDSPLFPPSMHTTGKNPVLNIDIEPLISCEKNFESRSLRSIKTSFCSSVNSCRVFLSYSLT